LVLWLAIAVAVMALAACGVVYRRVLAQERTIARQIAREASLKARFDDVFERTSDIVVVHDRRGRIATINRTAEQAIGYTREEGRAVDPGWIFTKPYLACIERMLADGADALPRTIRAELITKKNARIPIEGQARALVADGQLTGIAVIAKNVAERDQLEAQLRQAQKMEAVGRLATGIAHDFNNLITVLMGYSDELLEEVPAESPLRKPVEEVKRAVERAAGLTQQLLAFSRRQSTAPQRIDVNVTVGNMEGLLKRLLGPEIRLEVSLDPNIGIIEADPAQVGQIVMNLAVNARDAMPGGGRLSIVTANIELGAEYLDAIPGMHVMIEVHDTGVGMSPEVQRQLFEPFFTTKAAGHGTGLGLSMVNAIVRQSGGQVTVSSQPGEGTIFRVYFPSLERRQLEAAPPGPVANVDDTASADSTTQPEPAAAGAGVVLLAEDDRAVRRLMSSELRRRGFVVLEARHGGEALQICKQYSAQIDVLVTDVVMPTMNGVDLAASARPLRPDMAVVFMTGHPERAGVDLTLSGANTSELLLKPFTPAVLAERVQQVLDNRRQQRA
jgi:PAS domain S-box-containing protein